MNWDIHTKLLLKECPQDFVRYFTPTLNLDGFWPWLVLCEDGGNCRTVDMVFEYLYSKQRGNLILLAKFYADMILKEDDEKLWLQRRFDSMNEFLWENTSVYRDILASGKKQGFAQGEQKGLEQGLKQGVEALQRVIEFTIQTRFPCLLPLVKETIAHLNDLEQCQKLSLMLSSAQTEDEAKDALLAF